MISHSGKFVLRLSPDLHKHLKHEAQLRGLSLNQLCVERLSLNEPTSRSEILLPLLKDLPMRLLSQRFLESQNFRLEGVVLFGSMVRGGSTASSDIDLLLVLPKGSEATRELYSVWDERLGGKIRSLCSREVNPQFVSIPRDISDAGSLWLEVAHEGIVIWERDFALSTCLQALRKIVEKKTVVRKECHGQPYWIRRTP